ncbi:universal stress protein [Alginatibacterium sediminis]|uniref:Universal stress protein n=1 Tax=Alginatibacterium sediminis TaxID=2164068 RepID=A0A420EAP2_9ALTE|nr:universal stress protein [Alginatibacterium sediminis]RKF17767.1 universal stress protein [Alginatibacterium sediminis]
MTLILGDKIIACVDGSPLSHAVVDYAAWVANKVKAPLRLLHNIEHAIPGAHSDLSGSLTPGVHEKLMGELADLEHQRNKLLVKQGKLLLAAAIERAQSNGIEQPETKQRHGSLSDSLIRCEDTIRVLVLGLRGEAHQDDPKHIGAQIESVVRALHRPILVVNQEFSSPKNIMLAYDGSDASQKALEMVCLSPLFKDMPCHLVNVARNEGEHSALIESAKARLVEAGIAVQVAQLTGRADEVLCQYQNQHDIDLMVMGAFGHTRIHDLLLGSFTTKMLAATNKPMFLLR